ncbi:MAG: hypothetical protein ACYTG5_15065 [Planctomycetota bacterium]|jgi:hypothetical protein
MKKSTSSILAAAVSGLLIGASTGCTAEESTNNASPSAPAANPADSTPAAAVDLHACKGFNKCAGKGGCEAGDNGCAGKNSCEGKGGCATTAKHDCAGKNDCKGLGGCGSGDNGCKAKNSCKGKGGCAVPIKH